jgi:hypothetical protein
MLSEIIQAVMAEINTGRATAIPYGIGEDEVAKFGSPPRIVWVPTEDSFGSGQGGMQPRQVKTRIAGLEVHVWAASFADTETLLHDMVCALDAVARTSFEPRGVSWITEGKLISKGAVAVLGVVFHVPVTKSAPSLVSATITDVAGTATLPNE